MDNKNNYNYFSKTEFYPDSYINNLFKARGNWTKVSERDFNDKKVEIHFVFINGKYLFDPLYYSLKTILKNGIANHEIVTKKNNLCSYLLSSEYGKKYTMDTYFINAQTITKPKFYAEYLNLLTNGKIYILKPVSGFAGQNIYMISSFKDLEARIIQIKEKWEPVWSKRGKQTNYYKEWILQEYLLAPLLFKNPVNAKEYKFHLRHYFIFRPGDKQSFFLKKGLLATGLMPYVQGDWLNKDIHDTHFHGREGEKFPDALDLSPYQKKKIYKQIYELYSILNNYLKANTKCFNESKYCFHIFGADLMFTSDYNVKILELNSSPGLADEKNKFVQDEYKSIIENIMSVIVDDLFPPSNSVENKFLKDVVFLDNELIAGNALNSVRTGNSSSNSKK